MVYITGELYPWMQLITWALQAMCSHLLQPMDRQFENMIPTLICPEDESVPTFTPTFHWTAIKGAEHYRLEYTSDETCDFSVAIGLETRQTSYTPTDTFPNDFRYCWRVRVESGNAVGDWSPVWHFHEEMGLKTHTC